LDPIHCSRDHSFQRGGAGIPYRNVATRCLTEGHLAKLERPRLERKSRCADLKPRGERCRAAVGLYPQSLGNLHRPVGQPSRVSGDIQTALVACLAQDALGRNLEPWHQGAGGTCQRAVSGVTEDQLPGLYRAGSDRTKVKGAGQLQPGIGLPGSRGNCGLAAVRVHDQGIRHVLRAVG